jgi:hypothetical protein
MGQELKRVCKVWFVIVLYGGLFLSSVYRNGMKWLIL